MRDIRADESDSPRPFASGGEASEWQSVAEHSFEPESDGGLVEALITAIAAAERTEPMTIMSPPLFANIDVFALEELFFEHPSDGASDALLGHVQFPYRGYRVTVTSDGQIVVAEPVAGDTAE